MQPKTSYASLKMESNGEKQSEMCRFWILYSYSEPSSEILTHAPSVTSDLESMIDTYS